MCLLVVLKQMWVLLVTFSEMIRLLYFQGYELSPGHQGKGDPETASDACSDYGRGAIRGKPRGCCGGHGRIRAPIPFGKAKQL